MIAYVNVSDVEHLPAWRAFNRTVKKSGTVGIWHEAYVIDPGKSENIYQNMSTVGFGKRLTLQSATD